MKRICALLVVIAGCGGSSDTPKRAVQDFTAAVGKSDWKKACERIDFLGQVDLTKRLPVTSITELDTLNNWKSCPATLSKHAARLRGLLKGADPGSTRKVNASQAVVDSPKGPWLMVRQDSQWQIVGFPRR